MIEPTTDPAADEAEPASPAGPSPPLGEHPTVPAGQDLPAETDALGRLESVLAEGLTAIRAELAAKLTYDQFKEQQVERLHNELQGYKSDLIRRATEPLFFGLIKLHDHLGHLVSSLREQAVDELSPARLLDHLDEFRDDVELLLARHGVEPFSVAEETFDPRRQTAVERRLTEDPSSNGRIAGRVRPGFEQGAVLLQKERVAVWVAAPTTTPEPSKIREDLSP